VEELESEGDRVMNERVALALSNTATLVQVDLEAGGDMEVKVRSGRIKLDSSLKTI
jgi:hypothetical protein